MLASNGSLASQGGFPYPNTLIYSKFDSNLINEMTGSSWSLTNTVSTLGYKNSPNGTIFNKEFGAQGSGERSGNISINLNDPTWFENLTVQFFNGQLSIDFGNISIEFFNGTTLLFRISLTHQSELRRVRAEAIRTNNYADGREVYLGNNDYIVCRIINKVFYIFVNGTQKISWGVSDVKTNAITGCKISFYKPVAGADNTIDEFIVSKNLDIPVSRPTAPFI